MPWYKKLNEVLLPMQPVVTVGLLAIILISLLVLVKGDSAAKTGWIVYLISP